MYISYVPLSAYVNIYIYTYMCTCLYLYVLKYILVMQKSLKQFRFRALNKQHVLDQNTWQGSAVHHDDSVSTNMLFSSCGRQYV